MCFQSVVLNDIQGLPWKVSHTWQCPCISVVTEAICTLRLGALEGRRVCQLKKPLLGPRPRLGSYWEEQRRNMPVKKGSIDMDSTKSNVFPPICPLPKNIFWLLVPSLSATPAIAEVSVFFYGFTLGEHSNVPNLNNMLVSRAGHPALIWIFTPTESSTL